MTAHLSSRHLPNRSLRAGMYLIQLSALPGYCVRGRRRQPPLSTPACGSGVATAGAEDSLDRVFECKTLAEVGSKDGLGGLYAREAVGFGKAVVSAPIYNSLVVTDEPIEGLSIFGDRAHRRWQEEHQQLPDPLKELLVGEDRWDVRLTIWLLWLSQQGCPRWRRYTHSLPRVEEMSLLLNFSAEERAELQLPELVEEAETQRDWAHTVHNTYRGLIKELGLRGALDDTLWAMAMVRSRTFGESVDGENITLMMPFADMANHSSDYAASFAISSNREEFQIVSYKPLAAGEEVCITYGEEKSNEELIRDYGFVLKGNVNDRVRLALPPQVQVQLSGPDLLRCFNMKGSTTTLEGSDSAGGMRLQIACPDNADVDARRLISVLSSLPIFDGTPGSNRPAPRHSAPAAEHGSGRMSGFNPTNLSWSGLLSSSSRIPWPWSPAAASGPAPGVRAAANPVRQAVASSDATANERRSVHALTTLCRDAQQAFPTSAAHDMQLINAGCRQPVEKSASTPGGSAPDAEQPDLTTARSPTPAPLRLNPRIMTAVRCRLEHKLLLARAVRTLDQYADMLDRRVALPSS